MCAAKGITLPPIAFLMLMTRTIKTLIAIASTSLLVGTFPAVVGANPAGFTNEPDPGIKKFFGPLPIGVKSKQLRPSSTKGFSNQPDPGFNGVFKPLPRGVKINELRSSSSKGYISEPDVGTFLPKAKNQHMYFPRLPSRTKGLNSIDREPFPRIPSKKAKGIFSIDREPILRSPIKRANRFHSYPVTEW
ncbi:hypothetical protein Syncc9605_1050 [Synechococcus sp. CC9605]|nr:hypothetical protein Syncc9605_1050 [Synechococcus sp. CC9605]